MNITQPTSKVKWTEAFSITDEKWSFIYKYPFQQHISTTLQWSQTRINHRILATRRFLHMINIKDTSQCLYCNEEETITHMLWTCPNSQTIIKSLKLWLFNQDTEDITAEAFIFNMSQNLTPIQLYILLETKFYIFSTKHLEKQLSIVSLVKMKKNEFIKSWNIYRAKILSC